MGKEKINAKEKIKRIKQLASKKAKQVLLTTAIVGAGVASVAGISSHVKKEREKENDRINTEWKKEFADADSVYADAKTTHFYAHKELEQKDTAELESYSQKLKDEKQNQMAGLLWLELTDPSGKLDTVNKLFSEGAKVDLSLMRDVAYDPSRIKVGDSYEMMERLFKQYDEYGGYFSMINQVGFSGYDWQEIRSRLQKHVNNGDERYQKFVDYASKEIKKAKEEGSYWDRKGNEFGSKFNYHSRYYTLHPLSRKYELSFYDKIEILDVEIKKTEFQIKTGHEYEIDMTSKDAKKILDASQGIKKGYIEALKLKGKVKE